MELDKLSVQQSFQAALDNTEQTELFWTLDRMHYPDPIKPLEDFFLLQTYKEGFNSATKSYDIPLSFLYRSINHYHYTAIAPLQIAVDELQAQEVSAQKNLTEAVINLPEIWDKQFFPELQSYIKEWKAFDLGKAGLPQLLEHLDRSVIKYGKSYEIHFRIVFPLLVAITIFDEFYTDLFGKDTAFEPYGLLQGFSNKTLESDHELWKLSQEIGKTSEVKEIFINNPAAEVLQLLAQFSEGKKFLLSLQNYLEIYGHRRDKLTMGYPSWIENPLPVIDQLREYIVSKCTDPTESLASLTVEREEAIQQIGIKLKTYPEAVARQFEGLLKSAQCAVVLQEDHDFWIDHYISNQVRLVVMEIATRLVKTRMIDDKEDVWFLTYQELMSVAENSKDLKSKISERKEIFEQAKRFQPSPFIGKMPDMPPPDNPLIRAISKFFGEPPKPIKQPNLIEGLPGSPGLVKGRAKIIYSFTEAHKLQKGDILVTATTIPTWTPLFSTIGGLVTDSGGILSHGAIVAREYRIPAVVGTGSATLRIEDGQIIEVDGKTGTVRIVLD